MNKKIMLIAPVFFDYYKKICEELELLGFSVDYVCDAPSNSNLSKALGRINKKLISHSANKHFKNNLLSKAEQNDYDYILIVAGMTFSFNKTMIKKLKDLQENAQFVLYQWDSEKNLPHITEIHEYFDRIYSFERFDCLANDRYKFLPLFYTKDYQNIADFKCEKLYDCVYIGTAHPKKFKYINMISQLISAKMPKQFIYHYMPSKLKFWYHKLLSSEFKGVKATQFEYKKLSNQQIIDKIKHTDCVLDALQAVQKGLTMRTIECLGCKRKIITINEDIVNYDFYDPQNILIFDKKIDFDNIFFSTPYKDIDKEIYEKYSLTNWLKTMLEI